MILTWKSMIVAGWHWTVDCVVVRDSKVTQSWTLLQEISFSAYSWSVVSLSVSVISTVSVWDTLVSGGNHCTPPLTYAQYHSYQQHHIRFCTNILHSNNSTPKINQWTCTWATKWIMDLKIIEFLVFLRPNCFWSWMPPHGHKEWDYDHCEQYSNVTMLSKTLSVKQDDSLQQELSHCSEFSVSGCLPRCIIRGGFCQSHLLKLYFRS